ncbi:hypothetical protein F511_13565 [Dorcoceras hygrometricum]|uniref:Uncharacterized protein n=1 Tax=Dorcoceras hygrometricum TaxID=472368 RepID=A0A2Z7CY21_9LAMI|nr:hypothetical protein F511_13565 [Dorcoceras hygrometricum]
MAIRMIRSEKPGSDTTVGDPDPPPDCGRYHQSGSRPETRLLRQPALEGLTRSARTDSPRQIGRKRFYGGGARRAAAAAYVERRAGG